MSDNLRVIYGDVAPFAKERLSPQTNDKLYDTLDQLKTQAAKQKNYGNPCESYSVVLDGQQIPYPEKEEQGMGWISLQISDATGYFDTPIILSLIGDGVNFYSSQGLTINFDTYKNIFSTNLTIVWYSKGIEISRKSFQPDKSTYFCENIVDNYDSVDFIFYSINMPLNRLRVTSIDYGKGITFYGEELISIKCIQEIDPISGFIPSNTADILLSPLAEKEFAFSEKQPLIIFANEILKSCTFINSAKRIGKNKWIIKSSDYIDVMEGFSYKGGLFNNISAKYIMEDIFATASIPCKIDDVFDSVFVTGFLPYCSCREALSQVAFASQAIVDTSNSNLVAVFALPTEQKIIPKSRIMQGQSLEEEEKVSKIELTVHQYLPSGQTKIIYETKEESENTIMRFTEPFYELSIINGEIIEQGTTYAIINSYGSEENTCQLIGKNYLHSTYIKTRAVNLIGKIVSIKNATLISFHNVDKILDSCYNYFNDPKSIKQKIIEQKHIRGGKYAKYGQFMYGSKKYSELTKTYIEYDEPINVGDFVKTATEFLGDRNAIVTKETFNLSGGSIIKDSILR